MKMHNTPVPAIVATVSACLVGGLPQAHGQGACCIGEDCAPASEAAECYAMDGIFLEGADCADEPCGLGACCAALTCMMATAYDCITAGRDFLGAGTDCSGDPCEFGVGACCFGEACNVVTPERCAMSDGTWLGFGTNCVTMPCEIGACCLADGCQDLARHECVALGGEFIAGVSCASDPCDTTGYCPSDSLYAQSRDEPDGFTAFTSEVAADLQRWDDFTGVPGPIDALVWWGLDMRFLGGTAWQECEEIDNTFLIAFHADAGGVPGPAVCTYTLPVTRTPTGILYLGAELNEYSVTLPEPCVLVNGWISIVGQGDPDCWFLWMSAGPGTSWCDNCRPSWEGSDLSTCLLGTPGGVFGACCDDTTGTCEDNVEIVDCLDPEQRFGPDAFCDAFDPPCGVLTGACCLPDATCVVVEQADCTTLDGNWLGAFTPCWLCPCITPCPAAGVSEGEPVCYDEYVDVFNGGCDADTVAFSPISFCETVCGQSGVFLVGADFHGDFDWYELNVASTTDITFEVVAEFPVGAWIVDGRAGCGEAYVMTSGAQYECDTVSLTLGVDPGTYWLVVGPVTADDSSACGARYTAIVTQTAPCPGDMDGDGDVDLDDYAVFAGCMAGLPGCTPEQFDQADLDDDGDADLQDFALFQTLFTG